MGNFAANGVGPEVAGHITAAGVAAWTVSGSESRGSATSAATIATSPIWRSQAVRVESPGMADLKEIGTIYTT